MRKFFAYIRVSTPRQGVHGVSLQEQRDAILRYSQRFSLAIVAWFEERETAAKGGRAVFGRMLKELRSGKADGVIIHKIDRSARNLKDWSDLGELIDQGLEVHFVNESLDLTSTGGRLSADLQAVVAAHYVRNLREEVRKGFYGRLKQGLYPLPAPIGYQNKGGGEPKEIDPSAGPLIRKAFELYATGRYSLDSLVEELYSLGLRKRGGGKVTRTTLADLLKNPFYIGVIRIKRSEETFAGVHQPLVSKAVFDKVQMVFEGKAMKGPQQHLYLFRKLLRCRQCGYAMVGEKQKQFVYYRCQVIDCPTNCIREDAVEQQILNRFSGLKLTDTEIEYLAGKIEELRANSETEREKAEKAFAVRLVQVQSKLDRLTDAYIDRLIDKETFERRKATLLLEQKDIEERQQLLVQNDCSVADVLAAFLELAKSLYLQYQFGSDEQKRYLLEMVTSNRQVSEKRVDITVVFPFDKLEKCLKKTNGGPFRTAPRTFDAAFREIVDRLIYKPAPELELLRIFRENSLEDQDKPIRYQPPRKAP